MKTKSKKRNTKRSSRGAKRNPLQRPIQRMPVFVRRALEARGLQEVYRQRPAYQRNDYLGWIASAKREGTKLKRLEQMLAELERGSLYMKMVWHPPRPL